MRGTLHDGHFIPPKPVVPEPQDVPVSYGAAQASSGQGYNLRPPVPGATAQAAQVERKKAPSLFERITSGVRRFEQGGQEEDYIDATSGSGNAGAATGTGGFHAGLRAAPRVTENPAQGQLNIDAPAASRNKNADDLDIPAFLRRQAN